MKILLLDIETLPNLGWYWDHPWETSIIETVKNWQILAFTAKWLGGEMETHINHKTDKVLVAKLWKLLDECEVCIAHNGDKFDIRKINARFLYYKLPPPSPYRTVDTLKVARKYFALTSNKQDDLGEFLKTGRKLKTDKDLWLDCIRGDKKALKRMADYNRQDVILLEKNYLRLRPWIKNHPNVAVIEGNNSLCPKCGSREFQRRGFDYTQVNKYQIIWCKNCKGWSRLPLAENRPLKSI